MTEEQLYFKVMLEVFINTVYQWLPRLTTDEDYHNLVDAELEVKDVLRDMERVRSGFKKGDVVYD